MNAANVSAALRKGGLQPIGSGVSRTREGLRVERSGGFGAGAKSTVCVNANFDSDELAARLSSDAEAILTEKGVPVRRTSPTTIWVD